MQLAKLLLALMLGASNDVTPRTSECRLTARGVSLPPLRTFSEAIDEHPAEGNRLRIGSTFVAGCSSDGTNEEWRVERPGQDVRLLASGRQVAYFADRERLDSRLLRLDLERGAWLESWTLNNKSLGLEGSDGSGAVSALVLSQDDLFVVLCLVKDSTTLGAPSCRAHVVACLDAKSGKTRWINELPSADPLPDQPAVLLAPMLTGPVHPAPRLIQLFRGAVLVCLGAREPLRLLDSATGVPKWTLERLWEFQRGYVGPSVWAHFIDRFGIDSADLDESSYTESGKEYFEQAKREFESRRRAFEQANVGSIAAGPFQITRPDGAEELLVAVALGPRDPWNMYLSQCFVYEVAASGKPVSVVAVPRMMSPLGVIETENRVTAACEKQSFVSFVRSEAAQLTSFGVGRGADAIGRISWFRELDSPQRSAWLESDPAADLVAFNRSFGVRIAGGGWVSDKTSKVVHFPLCFVDPESGAGTSVELVVPFEGDLSLPSVNFTQTGASTHAHGAYGLVLTAMQLVEHQLSLVLANSKSSWTLTFDVSTLASNK